MSTSNIIETNQLCRTYGATEAVHNLSLQVPEGSIFAFLGPNGAGKTTTIKMVLNILQPTSGSARILGVESVKLGPPVLAQIGYVSENQKLPEWMTVRQLLDYCRPMYPTWDADFCKKLLASFELPLDRKISQLSRGMKMKVALVSSLAYRPKLLILDEPFSGLDPFVRDEFTRGMLELSEQASWTIFLSSHDLEEVERLADWVGFLNKGELVVSETTESLQRRYQKIEFSLKGETALPRNLPQGWNTPEVSGQNVRLILNDYRENEFPAQLSHYFPESSPPTVLPMSLRDIFIAIPRTASATKASVN